MNSLVNKELVKLSILDNRSSCASFYYFTFADGLILLYAGNGAFIQVDHVPENAQLQDLDALNHDATENDNPESAPLCPSSSPPGAPLIVTRAVHSSKMDRVIIQFQTGGMLCFGQWSEDEAFGYRDYHYYVASPNIPFDYSALMDSDIIAVDIWLEGDNEALKPPLDVAKPWPLFPPIHPLERVVQDNADDEDPFHAGIYTASSYIDTRTNPPARLRPFLYTLCIISGIITWTVFLSASGFGHLFTALLALLTLALSVYALFWDKIRTTACDIEMNAIAFFEFYFGCRFLRRTLFKAPLSELEHIQIRTHSKCRIAPDGTVCSPSVNSPRDKQSSFCSLQGAQWIAAHTADKILMSNETLIDATYFEIVITHNGTEHALFHTNNVASLAYIKAYIEAHAFRLTPPPQLPIVTHMAPLPALPDTPSKKRRFLRFRANALHVRNISAGTMRVGLSGTYLLMICAVAAARFPLAWPILVLIGLYVLFVADSITLRCDEEKISLTYRELIQRASLTLRRTHTDVSLQRIVNVVVDENGNPVHLETSKKDIRYTLMFDAPDEQPLFIGLTKKPALLDKIGTFLRAYGINYRR